MTLRKEFEDELSKKAEEMSSRIIRKKELIRKCDEENIKHNPDAIIKIEEINNRMIFLERGSEKSGYKHILEAHSFEKRGISVAQLPNTLFNTLKQNKIVGYQGKPPGRPIYQCSSYKDDPKNVIAITVADNGYMVGANPTRLSNNRKIK